MTATKEPFKVKIKNHMEEDLGPLSEAQLRQAEVVLRTFMETVRSYAVPAAVTADRVCPERRQPCESCAFNPATDDWEGFVRTAYSLAWATFHRQPFVCHADQPDWHAHRIVEVSTLKACASYVPVQAFYRNKAKAAAGIALDALKLIAAKAA